MILSESLYPLLRIMPRLAIVHPGRRRRRGGGMDVLNRLKYF
jgi:hypothetical protein